jgi:hypothetical protein
VLGAAALEGAMLRAAWVFMPGIEAEMTPA